MRSQSSTVRSWKTQPDRDITIVTHARGSDLDPSTREDGYTAKWGVDATAKPSLGAYTPRHRVPPEVWERLRLEDFLVTKIALRQRRADVGRLGLGADQANLTVKTLVAQGRRRGSSRQRGADDHDTHDLASSRTKSTLASRALPGIASVETAARGDLLL